MRALASAPAKLLVALLALVTLTSTAAAQRPAARLTGAASATANERLLSAEATLAILDSLEEQTPPPGTAADSAHARWLSGVRARLAAQTAALRRGLSSVRHPSADSTGANRQISEMESLNAKLAALQQAILRESQKYQTLSNASKARHDVAMNAIRNMKA